MDFNINGCELGLHPLDETVTRGNQTVTHWAVEGIDNCVNQLVEKGATILYKVADVGGGTKQATFINPWGVMPCG